MPDLSDKELDGLIEEATIDAYDDGEQLSGFGVMIEDNLKVPFETEVLGVTVMVREVRQTDTGIVAVCARGRYQQAISVEELPLPDPAPEGAEWIAAYRRWARFR